MKRVWLWIVAAAAALAGVVLLVLTGRRKTPVVSLPEPPPPPPDKPLVNLHPADDYAAAKAEASAAPQTPAAVVTRINARHDT